MNDELLFADEGGVDIEPVADETRAWKVLVVDDDEFVHKVTRLVLDDYVFEGRGIQCLDAYSGREAMELVADDVAVILLDVVMETTDAGLEVARFVREKGNHLTRIILRTGQPGEAPERQVVTELDINDYRQKTELTADRLVTAVTTAIRSYRDLRIIEESRRGLHLLAMSVAHQVRNRTMTIAGFANLVMRKSEEDSVIHEMLETILSESSRLEKMVGDVTGYAALEIGEMQLVSVRELLEEAMARVDGKVAEQGRRVRWELVCPDQLLRLDPEMGMLALYELLRNAVDFSDGAQPVVEVTVAAGRHACVMEIRDQGQGIAEKDMPFVFDPFFSLKPKGSGMGLCIARKVAMAHQWDLSLESEFGKGSLVRVVIPRRELTG